MRPTATTALGLWLGLAALVGAAKEFDGPMLQFVEPPPVPQLSQPEATEPPPVESFPTTEFGLEQPAPTTAGPPQYVDPQLAAPPDLGGTYDQFAPSPGRIRSYVQNRPRQVPLERDSWLNRPYSASFLLGGLFLDDPMSTVDGDPGILYGWRIGWDFAPRFGLETRLGGASAGLASTINAADLQHAAIFFWDVNWLWYPTGDTTWRPYFLVGTGLLDIDYNDPFGRRFHGGVFEVPFGVGMKYRYSTRLAMRLEVLDNYAFRSGLQSDMHNISVSAGLEGRFGGGRRRNYWPWNPGRDWW